MAGHQLKVNPGKTELLCVPGEPSACQCSDATARILGVDVDNQLSLVPLIESVTQVSSQRGADYFYPRGIIKGLLSLLSFGDWITPILSFPLHAIWPLQLIRMQLHDLFITSPSSPTLPLCYTSFNSFLVMVPSDLKRKFLFIKSKLDQVLLPQCRYLTAFCTPTPRLSSSYRGNMHLEASWRGNSLPLLVFRHWFLKKTVLTIQKGLYTDSTPH